MKNCWKLCLISMMSGWIFTSCKHPVPEGPPMSFSKDVQPIITANCTQSGCHGTTNTQEFTLLSYDDVIRHGRVRPGDALKSELYQVITENDPEDRMPRDNPPLSDGQIKTIYLWIQQGALNN